MIHNNEVWYYIFREYILDLFNFYYPIGIILSTSSKHNFLFILLLACSYSKKKNSKKNK